MVAIGIAAAALVVIHWAHPDQPGDRPGHVLPGHHLVPHVLLGPVRPDGARRAAPLHRPAQARRPGSIPQNSELLHGVGIVFLKTDFLSPLINLMWVALCLLAAWCVGRPYAIGGVTVLGAAVVLDSNMLVGSQAGQAPNDVAGLFFLMAAIAFLVDGAASAHAAREAASARRTEGYTATPTGELEPGVVEDVPVEGDPRALATVGAGPLFMAGLAAGLGIGTKITLLATIGCLTIGVAILGGRRHWLRALGVWLGGLVITCGFWYGRNFVYALNPFPQIHKIGPIHLPGPDQLALYPRPPHSLSEYYNDPTRLAAQALPGAPRPARAALAGDPRGRGRRPGLGVLQGRKRPDADPGRDRDGRWDRLHLHSADRLGQPR